MSNKRIFIFILMLPLFLISDNKNIMQEFDNNCTKGNAVACMTIAKLITNDYEISKDYAKKSCEIIGIDECLNIAYLYIKGNKKTNKDIDLGYKILDVTCDMGSAKGCEVLAYAYYNGSKVKKNRKIAFELNEIGCTNGSSQCCIMASYEYSQGNLTRQNYCKAKEFAGRACDLGNTNGCKIYKALIIFCPIDPIIMPKF